MQCTILLLHFIFFPASEHFGASVGVVVEGLADGAVVGLREGTEVDGANVGSVGAFDGARLGERVGARVGATSMHFPCTK